ncbi:hypothetical protein VaNZ11_006163 [Volvox africanus]|uniref:Uncharacterized protein n=1 Tax=Volvox africanus TaxID=51714 RepID=A0ABQ5S0I1_9CHLO|nr:hypothetical protein VaNZ11_006163 [Volvox africanus]
MDRPGSPRTGQLGPKMLHLYPNASTSSPRRVLISMGQVGAADRIEVSPRPNLVQAHLERFKASLQDQDTPTRYNARKKIGKGNSNSSVDIEPQLRAMGAISQERMAVDSSSVLGPRPSWEDTGAVPPPPPPQTEYVAKLDRSFHRPRVGNSAARIALLSQLGAGASDLRSWGRRLPPTSVLWADIAELRGSRRLRQYIAERKREGEAPLELLTDLADGWEELRQRQRQRQQQPLQQGATPQVGGTSAAVTSALSTATAAAAVTAPAISRGSSPQRQLQSPPQPVVYVAESDWPAAAAAVAAVAAAAVGVPAPPPMSALLRIQSSSVSSSNVTRLVDGPAKPAPNSVVLVHLPQKPADGSTAVTDAATATAMPSTVSLPPRPLRRASSLQMPSVTEVTTSISVSLSPVRRAPGGSGGTEASAAAAAVAAGFVPSLECYHTTYTLPSRTLTTGADKLSPRTLVSATRLVEVVEVVQPPRMRPQLRLSDSSGREGGTRVTKSTGEPCTSVTPQLPVRRHSVADPASWAAQMREHGGVGKPSTLAESTEAVRVRELATGPEAFPVAAWAAVATNTPVAAADCGAEDTDTISDVASEASSPRPGPFEAATSAILQAQRWKRLAASPAAGTQVGPGAFAHMAAVAEEAAPARTLGLVPALATSASQIVVLASAPAASVAGPAPLPAKAAPPPQPPPPGPRETKRMKSQTVAQLEKRWSLNGRAALAATSTASSSLASSSTFRLPFLSSSSSFSAASSSVISSASSLKYDLIPGEVPDTVFLTQVYGVGSASTTAMDVIHEESAEEEEDKPHGDLPVLTRANRRPGSHVSDPSHDRPSGLLPLSPPAAAAAGLPPRPPPASLRSRSMASITLTNTPVLNTAGAGAQTLNRQNVTVGLGRRVRVKELPPVPLPPAMADTAVSVAAADSGGGAATGTDSNPTGMGGATASGGGQFGHRSLRRLLSDQVRVATMVYGATYDVVSGGRSDDVSVPEEQHLQPLAQHLLPPPPPSPPPPPPPPQPQPQHHEEHQPTPITTEAQSATEQLQQPQQEEQPGQHPAPPPPYLLPPEPDLAEEPYVPSSFSRQPSPPFSESRSHSYGQGGLFRHSIGALSVLSSRTSVSSSAISDGCGGGTGAFFAGSVTDHSTDLSYLPGDTRCATSSFFTTTAGSSVAASETALTSPAPSTEPSWTPVSGPISRVSSAGSSCTITSRNNNRRSRTSSATAGTPAAAMADTLPSRITQTDSEEVTRETAATVMPPMQLAGAKGGPDKAKKSAAVGAAVVPSLVNGSSDRHPAIVCRSRSQEQFATKRSGGGYLIISTRNADAVGNCVNAASNVNVNVNTTGASSGGAAMARSVPRSMAAPLVAPICSGKAASTSIHVEVDADAANHYGLVEEKGLKLHAVVTAEEAAREGAEAAAGVDNTVSMVGAPLSLLGSGSGELPESHGVTMVY